MIYRLFVTIVSLFIGAYQSQAQAAYYTPLIAAWTTTTQPPPGINGSALTSGMSTSQKISIVNAWTVTGTVVPMIIPTYQAYNLIVASEFNALSATNQQLIRDILSLGTADASSGTQIRSRFTSIFTAGTQTFSNLSNLAQKYDTPAVPWVTAPLSLGGAGLNSPINLSDTGAAGLN